MSEQTVDPICVRINDAARMIGVGRTKLYQLIASNEIETVKLGEATRHHRQPARTDQAAARSGIAVSSR